MNKRTESSKEKMCQDPDRYIQVNILNRCLFGQRIAFVSYPFLDRFIEKPGMHEELHVYLTKLKSVEAINCKLVDHRRRSASAVTSCQV